jgi:hypothetical protein
VAKFSLIIISLHHAYHLFVHGVQEGDLGDLHKIYPLLRVPKAPRRLGFPDAFGVRKGKRGRPYES